MMLKRIFFSVVFVSVSVFALGVLVGAEPERVSITDFGAVPDSKIDCVAAVRKALETCKSKESAILVFPKGRYDFYPPSDNHRIYGIAVENQKNLVIDGQGSEFVFHQIMGVCRITHSENVAVRNFSVDWEKPFIAQGTIVDTQDDWIDIQFDTAEYPFEITDGKLFFLGEGWRRQVEGYTLLFDKTSKELVYRTRDNALGSNELFNHKAEQLSNNTVRFHGKPKIKPESGTIIALWLGRYIQVAFNLERSKDVVLENIDIYHSLSHGVVAFKTENITLRQVDYKTNEKKNRVFSLVADGYHLNTCKGLVTIENCTQAGMGDDFLNLHGMNVMVQRRVDDYTVEVGVSGKTGASYVLDVGDEVWFVNGETVQRGETGTIREIKEIRDGSSKVLAKHIVFERKIPSDLKEKDALENKTWTAELEVRGCNILKKHRARGLLITTPKRAVVENNYFRSAGTAILIEGDVNYWYESGAVNDLTIRNNIFEDCFSSGHSGDWGHAVITIHPSFQPQNDNTEAYHRNIRIENNTFKSFDYPILFARSVRNLAFTNNQLARTTTYKPFAVNQTTFWFDGCREVLIENNSWSDDVLGKNLKMFHMKQSDLKLNDKTVQVLN
ncbi:MAG: glycoside hydrolase family 55 protein [Planctomycetaceae bacterium]|nr:glycoside hydrolase family 55 protein [Planctomycetaceae bacterium]